MDLRDNQRQFFFLCSFLFFLNLSLIGLNISCNSVAKPISKSPRINGVCLVAPRDSSMLAELPKLERISPNYVAVIPYAFKRKGESRVNYYKKNPYWWGEGVEGCRQTIRQLKELGYKVMLKPHVWVAGDGWPGDFDPTHKVATEQVELEWSIWEESYRDYLLEMSRIAQDEAVEMFCIGTEYRKAVQKRSTYWKQLIREIREVYKGKLTYAANWDNYLNVPFWEELDYIGIDAYFPLSEEKVPQVEDLVAAWLPIKTEIMKLADSCSKLILFTEYGYRSIAYTARGDWKNKEVDEESEEAQSHAYNALYSSWWKEPAFAGGFLWKWHPADSAYRQRGAKGRFTPQGKRVEERIRSAYSK